MAETILEQIERSPDYLWLILLRALRESDLLEAADAQEQLAALGVEVRFTKLIPPALEGGADD